MDSETLADYSNNVAVVVVAAVDAAVAAGT